MKTFENKVENESEIKFYNLFQYLFIFLTGFLFNCVWLKYCVRWTTDLSLPGNGTAQIGFPSMIVLKIGFLNKNE